LTIGNAALFIACVSLAALAGAWTIEWLGYKPCPLCLEQRIPYYAAVPGGFVVAYLARSAPRAAAIILAALCVAFVYNAGLGIYHAGAEWHFWPGPDTCSGGDVQVTSLSQSLRHNQAVRCDEAALRIFGISLAGYSVLISGALAAVGGLAIWRSKAWR
jgi:disulfide bond formation protein DsbB